MDWTNIGDRKSNCYRFLLISEDPLPECRALALFHRLSQRLAPYFECIQQRWQFNELEEPATRQAAARAIEQANVVVLALNGAERPSPEVRRWIEELLRKEKPEAGPVVVLDHATVDLKGALINRRPVDLFIHDWQPSAITMNGSAEVQRLARPQRAVSGAVPAPWGINE